MVNWVLRLQLDGFVNIPAPLCKNADISICLKTRCADCHTCILFWLCVHDYIRSIIMCICICLCICIYTYIDYIELYIYTSPAFCAIWSWNSFNISIIRSMVYSYLSYCKCQNWLRQWHWWVFAPGWSLWSANCLQVAHAGWHIPLMLSLIYPSYQPFRTLS